MHVRVTLAAVDVPEFGLPTESEPTLPAALRRERLTRAAAAARQAQYTHLVVYADREHAAAIEWLTGYEPRFGRRWRFSTPRAGPCASSWGMRGSVMPLSVRFRRWCSSTRGFRF